MLEEFAKVSYRYFQEAKVYVIFTIALFGVTSLYIHFGGGWGDGTAWGTLILFLGVFGTPILFVFCLSIIFLCFIYAFHPELNGKEQGDVLRLMLTRLICLMFTLGGITLLYLVISGQKLS